MMKIRPIFEQTVKVLLFLAAVVSVLSVLFITLFILKEGVPLFFTSHTSYEPPSLGEFLSGADWFPTDTPPEFGILPFVVSSLMVTFGALVIAVPVGIAVGIFIAEIAGGRVKKILRSSIELLAGIPSVVYGFFGVVMIGFFLNRYENPIVNYNAFSAMIILAIMTLPTIINITEVSIRAVPFEYKECSAALGTSHWQTIWNVMLPTARGGIITGVILGMGRAIGETMAVLMIAGNQPTIPSEGLYSRVRTLTMAIINDMGYAGDDHRVALFAIAIVLFFFILLLNLTTEIIMRKSKITLK